MTAWATLVLAAYLFVNGLLVLFGMVSFASGAYLLGGLETMGFVIYLLVALVVALALAILGLSLRKGWRWSRRVVILAAGFLIAGAVSPVSAAMIYSQVWEIAIHGAKIVLAIVIIRYFLQPEVVDYFTARNGSQST